MCVCVHARACMCTRVFLLSCNGGRETPCQLGLSKVVKTFCLVTSSDRRVQPWSKAHHRPHLTSFSMERGTFKKQIRSGLSPADSTLMTSHCIQDNVRIPLCSSQGFTTQVLAALNLIPLATWHLGQQSRYVLPAKLCQRGFS